MKGQMWTIDFTLSLLVFTVAMVVSYTIITNTIEDRAFEDVRRQAVDAADTLASEGFPVHWTAGNVVRAGLLADGRLSLRKAAEMANLSQNDLRVRLRLTDSYYVHFTNASGTVSVTDECGYGDLTLTPTTENVSLPAAGIAPSSDFVDQLDNITVYDDESVQSALIMQDVIVTEGNLTNASGVSTTAFNRVLEENARRGITIVVIGDPVVTGFGVTLDNESTSDVQVQGDAGRELGLLADELLQVNESPDTDVDVPIVMDASGVENYVSVAQTEAGNDVYATWTYHDARVWFIGRPDGTRQDGSDLEQRLVSAVQNMIMVDRPGCGDPEAPETAEHVAEQRRVLTHHDQVLTMHVLVWREP